MTGKQIKIALVELDRKPGELRAEIGKRLKSEIDPSIFSRILGDREGDGSQVQKVLAESERVINEWKGARA